jgi:uncharacterized spore protein YtfJ
METEVQRLLDIVAELREQANVNAVFGEPMTAEGRTIIPVASVGYGFGMGGGYGSSGSTTESEGEEEGKEAPGEAGEETGGIAGGAGGGVQARPFAIIEVTPEGTRVEPIVDEQKLALAGSLLAGWGIFCLARVLVKIFGQRE